MSQKLELRILKKINIKTLEKKIKEFWFKKVEKNTFFYFEKKDFLSLWWIHLDFQLLEDRTIISTYSSGLRYKYDIDIQNGIIRKLKSIYGGHIYNDWSNGTYIKWWDINLLIVERACWLSYHKYYELLMRALLIAWNLNSEKSNKDLGYISKMMPENNITLLIIPFLVSWFEDFLKTFFIRYFNYSNNYKNKLKWKIDRKLNLEELDNLYNQKISIWDIVSRKFNFQNLSSIIEAYRDYCDLDFKKIINKRRKLNSGKFYNLYDTLSRIIEIRHKLIHEAEYIFIWKDKIEDYIDVFLKIWEEIVKYYKNKYWYKFDLNEI